MNKTLIKQYCKVLAENEVGIWFVDGSRKVAEFCDGCAYSCETIEDFEMLTDATRYELTF